MYGIKVLFNSTSVIDMLWTCVDNSCHSFIVRMKPGVLVTLLGYTQGINYVLNIYYMQFNFM